MDVKGALHVPFVEIMTTNYFKKRFSVLALNVRHFLEWLTTVDFPAAQRRYEIMKMKTDTRTKPLKKTMCARSCDPILKDIGTEQVRQIL